MPERESEWNIERAGFPVFNAVLSAWFSAGTEPGGSDAGAGRVKGFRNLS